MMRATFLILGGVFFTVGIAMAIAVALLIGGDYVRIGSGERAEGVVMAAPDNGKPIVEFRTRDGQRIRIEGTISASPTPYTVGERIGVFYDPANPDKALIDSFIERWFLPLLLGGFATVFTLIGGGFLLAAIRRARRWKYLMRQGLRIDGSVAGVEQNKIVKINNRRPWHVLVDWTDAKGETRRSRSEMLRDDPSERFKTGDRVTVLADPDDAKVFWIDLEGKSAAAAATAAAADFGSAKRSFFSKAKPPAVVRRD